MAESYDVIVVGAGPGGSVAATVAARSGLTTLLLDRAEFPREKTCGDAIPEPSLLLMRDLGIRDVFPASFFPIDYVSVIGPHRTRIKLQVFPSVAEKTRIARRFEFDNVLFQHAIRSGVEFRRMSVTEPILVDGQVVGIRGKADSQTVEISGKLVIAADGATSVIARGLGIPMRSDRHKSVSLRGYVQTVQDLEPTMELAFIKEVQPGYAWFFPLSRRHANIGVGVRSDAYKKRAMNLDQYLEIYRNMPHIKALIGNNVIENLKSWQLPFCSVEQQRVFNGAILVGDAGGFVNPLTGAGIYPAMLTGKYAAEVGSRAIKKGDLKAENLMEFEALWRKDLLQGMQASSRVQNLLDKAPGIVDIGVLASHLSPGFVRRLMSKV